MSLLLTAAVGGCSSSAETRPTETRLFLAGDGELWSVDPETETSRRLSLPQLSPGDPPYRILRRGDQLVLWGGAPHVLDPSLRHPPRRLRDMYGPFFPSARDDRIWVSVLEPRPRARNSGGGTILELDIRGKVTMPTVHTPGGVFAAVDDGLLLIPVNGSEVDLWDPATRKMKWRLPHSVLGDLGPAHRHSLASATPPYRVLRLTDTRTARQRPVAAPSGLSFEVWNGAFSPDGRTLAVPVFTTRLGNASFGRLALVDIRTRELTLVPGSRVPGGYRLVTWSSSGDHIFITGGGRFRHRVLVHYRMGDKRARVLDVTVGDFYGIAAS